MRTWIACGLLMLGMGCATTGQFETRVFSWEGKDSDTLIKTWGQPDATEKMANGHRIFLYSRLKHEPYSFDESPRVIAENAQKSKARKTASASDTASSSGAMYIKCATYFEVNQQSKVTFVEYRGDECKWKN